MVLAEWRPTEGCSAHLINHRAIAAHLQTKHLDPQRIQSECSCSCLVTLMQQAATISVGMCRAPKNHECAELMIFKSLSDSVVIESDVTFKLTVIEERFDTSVLATRNKECSIRCLRVNGESDIDQRPLGD